MKKIIRLTESDLARIVRRVIQEASGTPIKVGAKKGSYIDPTGKTIVVNKLPTELKPGQKLGGMSPDAELVISYTQAGGTPNYATIKSDTKNLSYENLAYIAVKAPQKTSGGGGNTPSGVIQRESRLMNEQIIIDPIKLGFTKWDNKGHILRLPQGSTNQNDSIRVTTQPMGENKFLVSVAVNGNKKLRGEMTKGLSTFKNVESTLGSPFKRMDDRFVSTSGKINGEQLVKIVKMLRSLKIDDKNNTFLNESMEKHSKREMRDAARRWVKAKSEDEREEIEMEFSDSDGWVKVVGDAYDEQW